MIPAWKEFSLLHFQLLFSILKSTVTCSWRTDTKHSSRQVIGTDKASSPNRLCDHQPLKEKPGGFNMQKGLQNQGSEKSCLPSLEPQGPHSVLLVSLPYPGKGGQVQAGTFPPPVASLTALPWEGSCS